MTSTAAAMRGPDCEYDPTDNGTLLGLNPALMFDGDAALEQIVRAIHHSPAWRDGRSVILTVWDENDYSVAPTNNKVLLIVDTNYGREIESTCRELAVLHALLVAQVGGSGSGIAMPESRM